MNSDSELLDLENFSFPGEMNVENIDVFCEKGVFEVEHSQRILEVRGHPYINVMADMGEGVSLNGEKIKSYEEAKEPALVDNVIVCVNFSMQM